MPLIIHVSVYRMLKSRQKLLKTNPCVCLSENPFLSPSKVLDSSYLIELTSWICSRPSVLVSYKDMKFSFSLCSLTSVSSSFKYNTVRLITHAFNRRETFLCLRKLSIGVIIYLHLAQVYSLCIGKTRSALFPRYSHYLKIKSHVGFEKLRYIDSNGWT